MPYIGYGLSYLIHVIIQIKMNNSFFCHKMLDRHTLVDQTSRGKRIVRCTDQNDFAFLCRLDHFLTDFISVSDNHAAAV